ncbi:hypothetical protein GFY24_33635 [Nocardia sp. SYP-A9097]|uniref:hypothetical protein n=1 Tax=Nocardia sp. SYP-A9097 TaxID=2663237 RepID=UPI00129BD2BA|nr:hypothetical protein [Nocardia sp. SYP-A9097]MRH92318.1 hypothetical protein [Nocardia sp. SYP-A9097]
MVRLDVATVVRHGAAIAAGLDDRWLRDGQRGLVEALRRRDQRHDYRVWSYMAGRRATAAVLAELSDAGRLGTAAAELPEKLGLIDTRLPAIAPMPLPDSMPLPWQPDDADHHDTDRWCAQTAAAAQIYRRAYADTQPFVLAETSRWHRLHWSVLAEHRTLITTIGDHETTGDPEELADELIGAAWETWPEAARAYPYQGAPAAATDRYLIVRGRHLHSDAVHREWLALHPQLATALGWTHDPTQLFTWNGPDGAWRARTRLFHRGQLSHQPPARTVCAQIWQVQLSDLGMVELQVEFPTLATYLHVSRFPDRKSSNTGHSGVHSVVSVKYD